MLQKTSKSRVKSQESRVKIMLEIIIWMLRHKVVTATASPLHEAEQEIQTVLETKRSVFASKNLASASEPVLDIASAF